MQADPLIRMFDSRTPEAVARQLAIVLASSTEWHLATLESMQERKATTKYEVRRMQDICDKLVEQCIDLRIGAEVRGLRGLPCQRLAERMKEKTNAG